MDVLHFYFWFPWLNFFNLNWIVQLIGVYLFILFTFSTNVFFATTYFFLLIFFFIFSLSLIQMELFSGFLIVIEFTVIFVFLILLFFLNVESNQLKVNLFLNLIFFYFLIYFFSGVFFFFFDFFYNYKIFNTFFILDCSYDSIVNYNLNDFISIFINYYNFNFISFILLCFLLLISSVICVNINKIIFFFKNLYLIDFKHKNNVFFDYFFLKKQNLLQQSNLNPNSKIIKKKTK